MKASLTHGSIAALIVACSVGFAAGRLTSSFKQLSTPPTALSLSDSETKHFDLNAALSKAALTAAFDAALNEGPSWNCIRALRKLAASLSQEDIPIALQKLRKHKHSWPAFNLELELLCEWARTDPKAALKHTEDYNYERRQSAVISIIHSWLEADKAAATAYIESIPGSEEKALAERGLLTYLAINDPSKAGELLKNNPTLASRGGWHILFGLMIQKDPRRAVELALSLPEGASKTHGISALLYAWGNNDPKASASWVKELPDGLLKRQAIRALSSTIAANEPKEAIDLAMSELPGGNEQHLAIMSAIHHLSVRDKAAAQAWIEQLPNGTLRIDALKAYVRSWAESDPKAALEYALEAPSGAAKNEMIANGLARWIANGPKAGIQWLDKEPDLVAPPILNQVINSLYFENPAEAAELLRRIPAGIQQNAHYNNIAQQWIQGDPDAAEDWLSNMSEGAARDHFMEGLVRGTAITDPRAAGRIVESLPAGDLKEKIIAELSTAWAKSAPLDALDWVTHSSQGKTQELAIAGIVMEWTTHDIDAASDWLNTMPPGSGRDMAVGHFSEAAVQIDPESAVAWAANIGNEDLRKSQLTSVISQWMMSNQITARQWVQSASVPADWKEGWLKK